MSTGEFQTYFHVRANRFAAFYSSEPVARVLGRGPLFDRLRFAVTTSVGLGTKRVLDVGCGSGPLFAPLATKGIHVTGIDPAEAMIALAAQQAAASGPRGSRGHVMGNPHRGRCLRRRCCPRCLRLRRSADRTSPGHGAGSFSRHRFVPLAWPEAQLAQGQIRGPRRRGPRLQGTGLRRSGP